MRPILESCEHTLGIRTRDRKLRKVKPVDIGDHEVGTTHQPASTYLNWIGNLKSACVDLDPSGHALRT
jgi:hypothetical protein